MCSQNHNTLPRPTRLKAGRGLVAAVMNPHWRAIDKHLTGHFARNSPNKIQFYGASPPCQTELVQERLWLG